MSGWVVLIVLYFTRMLAMVFVSRDQRNASWFFQLAIAIALEWSQCIFQLANVVSEVCPVWKGKWNWRGASLLASLAHRFFSVSFHSMKSLKAWKCRLKSDTFTFTFSGVLCAPTLSHPTVPSHSTRRACMAFSGPTWSLRRKESGSEKWSPF